jgi:hypothetical protein
MRENSGLPTPDLKIAVTRRSTSYLAFSPQIALFSFAFPLRLCASAVKV